MADFIHDMVAGNAAIDQKRVSLAALPRDSFGADLVRVVQQGMRLGK